MALGYAVMIHTTGVDGLPMCGGTTTQMSLWETDCPACATQLAKVAVKGWKQTGYDEKFILQTVLRVDNWDTFIKRVSSNGQ